jgi:hypothetical protein
MPTKTGVEQVVLMSESVTPSAEYNELLDSIKGTLASGQLRAARAVNNVITETFWKIGRDIVARRQKQGWGAKVTDRLSADLRAAHPGTRGLSARNLRYMATLASRWPSGIGQRPIARLPWGLVATLLDSCPEPEIADFYAQRAVAEGWTRPVLQTMITTDCTNERDPRSQTSTARSPNRSKKRSGTSSRTRTSWISWPPTRYGSATCLRP